MAEAIRRLCFGPPELETKNTRHITNSRGQSLFCRYWPPHGQELGRSRSYGRPRAYVFISHGFSEHLGNYHSVGIHLSSMGCFAFGHDHVGHGKSEGKAAYLESADDMVEDLAMHTQVVRDMHEDEDSPLFIVGHSMGGMVAVRSALLYPSLFSGVVLIGPLIIPGPRYRWFDLRITTSRCILVKVVLGPLCWVRPELVLGSIDFDKVTRDETVKRLLARDPLRWQGGMKVATVLAFVECLQHIMSDLHHFDVPFLSLHGQADALCNVEGSILLEELCRTKDKRVIVFPGAAHQLLFELEDVKDKTMREIAQWIHERAPAKGQ